MSSTVSRRVILLTAAALSGMWAMVGITRAEEEVAPTRSSRSGGSASTRAADTGRSSRAPETGATARVEAKLDQVLANQEQIMARLDQVLEELKIVKIRATVR